MQQKDQEKASTNIAYLLAASAAADQTPQRARQLWLVAQ